MEEKGLELRSVLMEIEKDDREKAKNINTIAINTQEQKARIIEMVNRIDSPAVVLRCYKYIQYIYLHNN